MVVLLDTNIILDIFMDRGPYAEEARIIMTKCADREIIGYLAAHSIPNLFYILRKAYSQQERRRLIRSLCDTMADYIITRNAADYKKSRVKVIEPDEFMKLFDE